MVFKNILSKAKSALADRNKKIKNVRKTKELPAARMEAIDAPNRFLRFYYANRKELLAERKETYNQKLKKGICVRCNSKAVSGIKYCAMHREMQREYNRKAREKRKRKENMS
ncbi:hypothetical protein CL619_01525 [archaeon]|nr:hypothetical protein [archaeon]|tara:strand:- start:650 stop:985 length:336 start_codon:yes stop_codon:yes gene_type:complete